MGAFKLGKMTFGSLFKKPATVMYPIERKPQPMGLKGHIALDAAGCILCGMCDRSCATGCIAVDKQSGTWSIDRLQCVQCGYCITVCPKKCLSMNPDYAPATTVHERDVVEVSAPGKPIAKGEGAARTKAEAKPKPAEGAVRTKAEARPEPSESASPAHDAKGDEQVAALLGLMEPEKAEKARKALMA